MTYVSEHNYVIKYLIQKWLNNKLNSNQRTDNIKKYG